MYLIVSSLMLFKGFVDAVMMRAQQALSVGDSFGYLSSPHFQQIFTAHGATMIFFVAMGLVFSLINIIVPLQIGARDVAFPFLNSLSFWPLCRWCRTSHYISQRREFFRSRMGRLSSSFRDRVQSLGRD